MRKISLEDFKKNPVEANRYASLEGAVEIVDGDRRVGTICVPRGRCLCWDCSCGKETATEKLISAAYRFLDEADELRETEAAEELKLQLKTLKEIIKKGKE